ncbi:MAG: glycosyltransferase family 2 protein [Chitinophagales bacterium]|nr:glycosyltransferase family 2 protein [Chitinophagales bacterium]
MSEKLVSVVILNWNGVAMLEKFLPTVIQYTDVSIADIVVADNGSTDNSIDFLIRNFPEVKIVRNDKNYGFAGGYNESLKHINSEYYVLLNSDVEVTDGWLAPMLAKMQSDERIFACQPKLRDFNKRTFFEYAGAAGGYIDKLGYPFCRGRIMDFCEEDTGQYDVATEIFWASGACIMVRADLFKACGGFDADFFAHMEEIDLCWRMKNLGYSVWYVPESVVYHVGGGTLQKSNPRKTYLNFHNNRALLIKNEDPQLYAALYWIREMLFLMACLKFLVAGKWGDARAVWTSGRDFSKKKSWWLQKRREQDKLLESLKIDKSNTKGFYYKSIVFQFFIKRIKIFNKLNWTS